MKNIVLGLGAALVAVACGGASTGDAEDDTASSHASLVCEGLAPTGDVCALGFLPDASRALSDATLFARLASGVRADVDTACAGALADLGRSPPADGSGCRAVSLAIGGAVDRLEIHVDEPRCEAVAPPACVGERGEPHVVCTGAKVTAIAPPDATDFERLAASVVTKHYGLLVGAKRQVSNVIDVAGSFSGSISAVASLPAPCASRVNDMVRVADDDLRRAIPEVEAALSGVIDRP